MPNLHKQFKDTLLSVSVEIPLEGRRTSSDTIILHKHQKTENQKILVEFPALPYLASGKQIQVLLQHSDTNQRLLNPWKPVQNAGSAQVTGAKSDGSTASVQYIPLPNDVKQYLRAVVITDNHSGNNTAHSITISLVY